jgi:hypothetical protein
MALYKITVTTKLNERSPFEINEFIDNLKESFEKVTIISIKSLQMKYDDYYKYTYEVKFYHDLYLKT